MEERSNLKKKSRIQQNHERVINLPEMQHSFLDSFNLENFNLPKVSVIIPTYNRCSHTLEEDANPLGWCLESLLTQRGGNLDEIIIVDDASSDFTSEIVKKKKKKNQIPINYLRNIKNKGSSISRNIGVEKSKNDFVLFLDDDCIFSNYFVFGANFTLNSLSSDVAVVHMPIYHRKIKPDPVDIKDIGLLDLDLGLMTGNYGGFPTNYAENLEENLLNTDLKILNPLEIKNLGGVFISRKEAFRKVGGFPDYLAWKNGYREETDVALKLSEKGYKMFFTPDPKFYCVHLKYGAKGQIYQKEKELGELLKRLVGESNVQMSNTGNRVDSEEWFFDNIISTYVILGRRNKQAAKKYINKTYEAFVVQNNLSVGGVQTKIDDRQTRKIIFNRARIEGDRLIESRI